MVRILPGFSSIKDVKIAILRNGVYSQKELDHDIRLGISLPHFQRMREKYGKPIPVGSDFGFYNSLATWFGEDVISSLIEKGLVEPVFDFADRDKNTSLPEHLRQITRDGGWKE